MLQAARDEIKAEPSLRGVEIHELAVHEPHEIVVGQGAGIMYVSSRGNSAVCDTTLLTVLAASLPRQVLAV